MLRRLNRLNIELRQKNQPRKGDHNMATTVNYTVRVGEIRPSQLMFTYGVGALIDLPKLSVIVTGLDDWPVNPEYTRPVNESRLLQAVQFHLPGVEKLLAPPVVPETGAQPDPLDPA